MNGHSVNPDDVISSLDDTSPAMHTSKGGEEVSEVLKSVMDKVGM